MIELLEAFYLLLAGQIGYGFAAIGLSIIVNVAMYPVVISMTRIAEHHDQRQQLVESQAEIVKREHKGRDQHERLKRLYRRYNYSPLMSVVGLAPLLVQLPIFFLCFWVLENIRIPGDAQFYLIQNLNEPDGLLPRSANLLPLLMTSLNIMAAFMIPRVNDQKLAQSITLAIVFLFLLYNASSLLLLYWTTSNILILYGNAAKFYQLSASEKQKTTYIIQRLISFVTRPEQIVLSLFSAAFLCFLIIALKGSISTLLQVLLYLTVLLLVFQCGLKFYREGLKTSLTLTNTSDLNSQKINLAMILIPVTLAISNLFANHQHFGGTQLIYLVITTVALILLLFSAPVAVILRLLPIHGVSQFVTSIAMLILVLPLLSAIHGWGHASQQDLVYLSLLWAVSFAGLLLLGRLPTKLLFLIIGCFSVTALSYSWIFSPKIPATAHFTDDVRLEQLTGYDIKRSPNIYLLTYDAYVGNETLSHYGIDNSKHEDWLQNKGFMIHPGVYTVALPTLGSMSRMLDLAEHDMPRLENKVIMGNAVVPRLLSEKGYSTHAVFGSFALRGDIRPQYDQFYPEVRQDWYLSPTLGFTLDSILGITVNDKFSQVDSPDRSTLEQKRKQALQYSGSEPRLVLTHMNMPQHSKPGCSGNWTKVFPEKLEQANVIMIDDVETILSQDKNSIIIIVGDHGPYLTRKCSGYPDSTPAHLMTRIGIQDTLGSFVAIRWPEGEQRQTEIRVLQDTFSVVLDFLFDRDLNLALKSTKNGQHNWIEEGVVEDGIIQKGPDRGKLLYINTLTNNALEIDN